MNQENGNGQTGKGNAQANLPQLDTCEITSERIILGTRQQAIDISSLPEETRVELQKETARRVIENQDRLAKVCTDVHALGASLEEFARTGTDMAESGLTFTATNTRDDSLGRTEIMIGNSEAAQRGRLSRSQVGSAGNLSTQSLILIIIAIVAVTVITLAVVSGMG